MAARFRFRVGRAEPHDVEARLRGGAVTILIDGAATQTVRTARGVAFTVGVAELHEVDLQLPPGHGRGLRVRVDGVTVDDDLGGASRRAARASLVGGLCALVALAVVTAIAVPLATAPRAHAGCPCAAAASAR